MWLLRADVVCLCHDGNVADAALIALTVALRSLKVPTPSVADDGEVTAHPSAFSRLTLGSIPLPLTLAVIGSDVLSDPSSQEEAQAAATVTVVLTSETKVRRHVHAPTRCTATPCVSALCAHAPITDELKLIWLLFCFGRVGRVSSALSPSGLVCRPGVCGVRAGWSGVASKHAVVVYQSVSRARSGGVKRCKWRQCGVADQP